MYFLQGKLRMENRRYEVAIRLFERAQAQMQPHSSQALLLISVVSLPAFISRVFTSIDR